MVQTSTEVKSLLPLVTLCIYDAHEDQNYTESHDEAKDKEARRRKVRRATRQNEILSSSSP
jgi:hypothetical protein